MAPGPLKNAAEEYEEELEEFAQQETASQEWLEGMRNWAQSITGGSSDSSEENSGNEAEAFSAFGTDEGTEEEFDPLGRVADLFQGVGGVEKQDVCKSLYNDIAEIGKRSAVHQDLANLLEDADEGALASDVRDVSDKEKEVAQTLLRVANELDCDVPSDLKNAVNKL